MKFTTILLAIFSILPTLSYSQVTMVRNGDPYLETLKKSTLVFIKTGDNMFDQSIEKGLDDHWSLTEIIVVSDDEKNKYLGNETYSILSVNSISMTSNYMSGGLFSDGLSLFTQDANASEVYFRNIIAFYPINKEVSNFRNSAEYIIQGMQDIVTFVSANNIRCGGGPDDYVKIQGKVYNELTQRPKEIGKKTLLVNKSDLTEKLSEKKFLKEYKGPVKFVDQEAFDEIVSTDNPEYCAFHVLRWPAPFVQVHDVASKTLLYSGPGGSSYGIKASIDKYMFVHDGQIANLWGWIK